MKKETVSKVKKKALEWFSKYIRGKYSLVGTNCVTCGQWKEFKKLQAGHWIPGRHNSVLFDERNVHPQCYHCNVGLKGNPIKYWHFMEKTYGREVMQEIEEMDREIKQFKVYELKEILEKYKKKFENLR